MSFLQCKLNSKNSITTTSVTHEPILFFSTSRIQDIPRDSVDQDRAYHLDRRFYQHDSTPNVQKFQVIFFRQELQSIGQPVLVTFSRSPYFDNNFMKEILSTFVIREDLQKLDRDFRVLCCFIFFCWFQSFSEIFHTWRCIKIKLNWSLLDLVEDCWIQVTFDVVEVLKMVLDSFGILYRIWADITMFVSETFVQRLSCCARWSQPWCY